MSAPLCKKQGYGNNKLLKNVLMKSLSFLTAIYHMHAVLNFLIIDGKEKFDNIILLLVN